MKTFQFSLKGYDGSTDEYDNLMKWVNAPNRNALNQFLDTYHVYPLLTDAVDIEDISGLDDPYFIEDGVDVIVDENGTIVAGLQNQCRWVEEVEQARICQINHPKPKPKPQCVFVISGGTFQEVFTDTDLDIVIVDWDNINDGDKAGHVKPVPLEFMEEELRDAINAI